MSQKTLSAGVQGLFERHKLVVATQLAMAILRKEGNLTNEKVELLMSPPGRVAMQSPLPGWLPDTVWAAANALKVAVSPPSRRLCSRSPGMPDVACLPGHRRVPPAARRSPGLRKEVAGVDGSAAPGGGTPSRSESLV